MKNNFYNVIKKKIVEVSKRLTEKGFVIGPGGNVSYRIHNEDKILITPTGIVFSDIKANDILLLTFDGDKLEGNLKPSRETGLHLKIYKEHKDAGAIIHSHPPFATTLAIVGKKIPPLIDEFVAYVGKEVNIAEYGMSGSETLVENVAKAIGDSRAVLLANHGLLAYGKDLEDAFFITQLVEETAKIYVHALSIGKPRRLPENAVKKFYEFFKCIKS
ncbi:MAG: class II aldolase/adducin family protein [Candidatus Odinarchaeia archaeon]